MIKLKFHLLLLSTIIVFNICQFNLLQQNSDSLVSVFSADDEDCPDIR